MLRKILSVILTPVYLLVFAILLVVFHPIQVFTRWIWGYPVRKKVVDVLNFGLLYSLWILGTKKHSADLKKFPRTGLLLLLPIIRVYSILLQWWSGSEKITRNLFRKLNWGKGFPAFHITCVTEDLC